MAKYIKVTAVNKEECVIFTDHIVMVQRSKKQNGAFIYTKSNDATILTLESYEDVLKMLFVSPSDNQDQVGVKYDE